MNPRLSTLAAIAVCVLTACATRPPDEPYGIVSVEISNVPKYVYPVRVAAINGEPVRPGSLDLSNPNVGKLRFELPPGDHVIRVTADLTQATGSIRSIRTPREEQPGEVKIFVEAGRRYYVGAYFPGGRRDEWKAVVWKVEDIESYEHDIQGY